jgi:magnesium chelatase family protein
MSGQPPATATDRPASPAPDLACVRCQDDAKRALEIALAGGHSILLIGPADCGKTLLLDCLPTLLPPLPDGTLPPIRRPHPESTPAGMLGSARIPGEVARAHQGVLVLDDLEAFRRATLRALRQPLAEGVVRVARRGGRNDAPAAFFLVAALRTCPCGGLSWSASSCRCTARAIERYRRRIWEVLGASFAIVSVLLPPRLRCNRATPEEPSAAVEARIAAARRIQWQRFGAECENDLNEAMTPEDLRRHCALDASGAELCRVARERLALSTGALASALRVARTIADLEGRHAIRSVDLAAAIGYRSSVESELRQGGAK